MSATTCSDRSLGLPIALVSMLVGVTPSGAQGHQANRAPAAEDVRQTALYRADETWTVTTTIYLSATDPDPGSGKGRWTFQLVHPERLRDESGGSRLTCTYADPEKPGARKTTSLSESAIVTDTLRIECAYHPPVRFTGDDTFEYQVTDDATPAPGVSAPATVTINVKPQGLRWEMITSAGQALSGSSFQDVDGRLPDIIGRGTQDLLLRLDWLFRNPQHEVGEDLGRSTFDGHFAFQTGLVTKPESVAATPVAALTGEPITDAAPETALVARRQFTVGGELNYNWVLPESPSGAFIELGGLARGSFDASIEGDADFERIGDTLVKLVSHKSGAGSFRGELGGRVVLKQYHAETLTQQRQRGAGKPVEYARNADDFVTCEFGYQRNTSLQMASSIKVSENRYFVRVIATPLEIPGIPGHGKPLIGVELNGGPNQPKQVKVLYGANISAIGKALGLH